MGAEVWIGLISAISGGLISSLFLLPKLRAEARKLNREADGLLIDRLTQEIERLDREIEDLRSRFTAAAKAANERECALEKENKLLRAEIKRLRKRIEGLETIFKLHPIPPEMQAALAALESK